MFQIDLNCDLGEGFGNYKLGFDEEILNYITSANIACGFHAGDPSIMGKTVKQALEKGVAIGAHPGLADLIGFGRRNMDITPREAYDLIVYQIGALYGFIKAEGAGMQHVKPHGALYNMAAKSQNLSEAIAEAIYKIDPQLILFGLAGSKLIEAGQKIGLRTANEVFADRTYQQDGSLTPRSQTNALIADVDTAAAQVLRMVKEGKVQSQQGIDVSIKADTICLHGDSPHAREFSRRIKGAFEESNIYIKAFF